ncbi:MAG: tRNA pseudouridine(38-40) synthase TruA [Microthrixaceae bacterium]
MRLRLDVAYDGAGFHGFAENRDVRTVGGELRAALERVMGQDLELTCAGRTDTGVHARGQVVSVTVRPRAGRPAGPPALRDALNGLLGPEVVVGRVLEVPSEFDARFSARARTYRYRVLNRPVPDPFLARTAWWVSEPLDRHALDEACIPLLGEHDFSSFCRRPRGRDDVSLVRRITDARWAVGGDADGGDVDGAGVLDLWLTATAFCHQMVRSITGLLVEVGRGRRTPADVAAALAAADRSTVPTLAPPHGLTLWRVDY